MSVQALSTEPARNPRNVEEARRCIVTANAEAIDTPGRANARLSFFWHKVDRREKSSLPSSECVC